MHHLRSIRRLAVGAAVTGAAVTAVPAMASAAVSDCTYDPVSHVARVTFDGSGAEKLTISNPNGHPEIEIAGSPS